MQIKVNYKPNQYCVECKDRIEYEEKYAVITEEIYDDQKVKKSYHLDCIPTDIEDEAEEDEEE